MSSYKPTSSAPLTKVTAGTLAAALVALVVWLIETYAHAEVPSEVANSLTLVVFALVAYLTPILPGEIKLAEQAPVLGHSLQLATLAPAAPDEAAMDQARASGELAEDALSRIDELTRRLDDLTAQLAERLGDGPGAG